MLTVIVFYYQFKLPGQAESEEPWWVMWDYNIGLVRMTHLFKSNGHSKVCNPSHLMIRANNRRQQ